MTGCTISESRAKGIPALSNIITGSCHCDNVAYEISTKTPLADITARSCDCRFCRMHAAQTWSDPAGSATIRINHPNELQKYRFALQTADFFVCRTCGAYIGAVMSESGKHWSTLNLRLSGLNPATISASYGHEEAPNRILRRQRHWTPTNIDGH